MHCFFPSFVRSSPSSPSLAAPGGLVITFSRIRFWGKQRSLLFFSSPSLPFPSFSTSSSPPRVPYLPFATDRCQPSSRIRPAPLGVRPPQLKPNLGTLPLGSTLTSALTLALPACYYSSLRLCPFLIPFFSPLRNALFVLDLLLGCCAFFLSLAANCPQPNPDQTNPSAGN